MASSGALPHPLFIHGTSATNGDLGTMNYAYNNDNNNPCKYITPRLLWRSDLNGSLALNQEFNALPISKDAPFNSYQRQHHPSCLPDTRVDLFREMHDWADGEDSPGIFWLSGLAGTGKLTIAQTVAAQYDTKSRLAAGFFFLWVGGDVSHAGKFIISIAF